jgi:5S rRNA maturation endonuclease (ribonuclease M5)
MVHSLFSTGKFELYGPVERHGVVTIEKRVGTLNELHGRLGFIDGIDLFNKKNVQPPQKPSQLSKKEGMYRQFLIYKDFYTAERPVIMCEGETDNVYLNYAIRSLAAQFPELAEVAPDGKIALKVRLYKYTKSSTARILGLHDGGNTALYSFLTTYTRDTNRFKAPGQKKPVIILYDSDSGAQKIRKAVEQAANIKMKGTEQYVHVVRNMYAMPTPLLNGNQQSKIEDFFDAATKATVLGGKTFIDRNKFDITKHYGKRIFAEQVVKAKANNINFAGFQPLLTVLETIIKDHATAVSGVATQTS